MVGSLPSKGRSQAMPSASQWAAPAVLRLLSIARRAASTKAAVGGLERGSPITVRTYCIGGLSRRRPYSRKLPHMNRRPSIMPTPPLTADMKDSRPTVLLIAGPTASGKSALAAAVAAAWEGTVINADSMQVYRELELLTARPRGAELKPARSEDHQSELQSLLRTS